MNEYLVVLYSMTDPSNSSMLIIQLLQLVWRLSRQVSH